MGELLVERNISYSLRGNNHLSVPIPCTNAYGLKAIRYTAHKLWQSLPLEISESYTLTESKSRIKNINSAIATVDCVNRMQVI